MLGVAREETPRGIDAVQSNLPESYAGGGIVALAGGGYTDPMGNVVPGEEPDYKQEGPGLFNDIKQWWKEHTYGTPESFKKEEAEKKAETISEKAIKRQKLKEKQRQ